MQVYIVQEGSIKPVYNLGFVYGVFKNYEDAIRYAAESEMEMRDWKENLDFYKEEIKNDNGLFYSVIKRTLT